MIENLINNSKKLLISRLGANEAKATLYPDFPFILKKLTKKIIFNRMYEVAGFYPTNEITIKKFSNIYKKAIKNIDILVSWRIEERFISEIKSNIKKVSLQEIEPYLNKDPWTRVLKNKKVLVIHPLDKTISTQYLKRTKIFKDKNILPKFDLITFKALQSFSGGNNQFNSWFEGLEFMKKKISKIDFDIALIGCGAYGLPLASYIKDLGKISVHMGGCLQILFGIKGRRWDENKKISSLYNKYWVRPSLKDRHKNYLKVENGCYW